MNGPSNLVAMLSCPPSTIKRLGEAVARKVQRQLDAPAKLEAAQKKRDARAAKRIRAF